MPVDDVKINPAEYPKYLKSAYKEEKFPKPSNIIGMAKDLPVAEMEKLMLTHLEVKDDDHSIVYNILNLQQKESTTRFCNLVLAIF